MKKKENLFRLIKAMSVAEKKHFRKVASLHVIRGENNYLKLFDVLDRQKEYDPAAVRNALRGESLLGHLASSKYYLYKLILKSLRSFHCGSSADSRLRDMLGAVEVLHEKGLFDDVSNLLGKARRLAEKYQRHLPLMEICRWENRVAMEKVDLGTFERSRKSNLEEMRSLAEKELLAQEINLFRDPFVLKYAREGNFRDVKGLKEVFNAQQGKLKGIDYSSLSFNARKYICLRSISYYMLILDYQKSIEWSEKTISLLESNPHFLNENPKYYLQAFAQQMTAYTLIGKYRDCLRAARKMKAISVRFPVAGRESAERFIFSTVNLELAAYINAGLFREGIEAIRDLETRAEQFRGKLSRYILIPAYYNASFLYFTTGDFTGASSWISKILNNREAEGYVKYILCCARMMNLMIHFEKGNHELVQYLSKSTMRYLSKKGELYACEVLFLNAIRKISITADASEQRKLFKDLKGQLEEFRNLPDAWQVIEQLELNTWVESKLSRKSFEELFRKKLRTARKT